MAKLILITGVSQGLGKAMAEKFIELGHTVVGCARNKNAITQLQNRFAGLANFSVVDLTRESDVKTWSHQVLSKIGIPDLLINSAGMTPPPGPLWTIESKIFNQVIDVNIKGVANIIRHFVPPMVQHQQGVIVNFSAGWGRYTAANAAPYCASKWAIEGMTSALAQELPSGMAAVSLAPGVIHTQALEIVYGKEKAKKYLSPQQWAKIAAPFLLQIGASDNGKQLTMLTG